MSKLFFFIIIILTFYACDDNKLSEHKPLAKVQNKVLYIEEIKKIFPEDIKEEDSVQFVRQHIKRWVKKQLLIQKAELNLTNEEKNVNQLLVDYRSSLIIFRYEQNLLKEKLDSLVSEQEIELYYERHTKEFVLNRNIVYSLFIKVPKTAPRIYNVRTWYKEKDSKNFEHLKDYCFQYAEVHNIFDDDWMFFDDLLANVPNDINKQENFLKNKNTIEAKDSLYFYFVSIKDFKLKGSTKPLYYVKKDIKTIILNKRKIKFIENLENNIYEEAVKRNDFTIFE